MTDETLKAMNAEQHAAASETVEDLLMQAYADGHMRGHESTVEGWFSSDAEEYAREWMKENADRIERAREREGKASGSASDGWREQERLRLLRLRTLLDGFEVRLERNELQPPATYLDEVTLWSEMQPGQGRIVCEELRKILSEPVRIPATPPASAPEVTEEMVERACGAYDEEHGGYRVHRLKMRRALIAALTEPKA